MDWSSKRVLVLGTGRTGRSAAAFLADRGAHVVAADEDTGPEPPLDPRVEWRVGKPFPAAGLFDVVVPSPGIPPARYRDAQQVLCDVEIAADGLPTPVVAITGSNGKTTSVLLLEAMLQAAGRRARAAGNVGVPALALVGEALDVAIFEVSSFQLEICRRFRPTIAVVLNLEPDHLDRHGTVSAYAAAKARLFAHQEANDVAIVNGDAPETLGLAAAGRGRKRLFSTRRAAAGRDGAWIEADCLVCVHEGETIRLARPANSALPLESLLACTLCCSALGVSPLEAARAWPGFRGPPHRRELIAVIDGVHFVNDSKATNPSAARHALLQCEGPAIWIAGGRDKGDLDLEALFESAARHARAAVWYGEVAERLEAMCAGRFPTAREQSLEAALRRAFALAEPGDTVLLSPAFASFDQFRDFEERGECFRREVRKLHTGARQGTA